MRRSITIVWEDDCEFDSADHYRFTGEFYRLITLAVVKYLQHQEQLTGYRAKVKVTQD